MTAIHLDAAEGPQASATELEDDASRFLLHSRFDIVAVLRDIARARTLVNVHFGSSHDSLLTPLLAVDSTAGEIVFDCSGSSKLNQSLMQAHRLLFYASHGEVKIRFATAAARRTQYEGEDAFTVRLPSTLLRLQRREFYRMRAPVAHPIQCLVTLDASNIVRHIDTRVHDISQGGVSLIVQPGTLPAEVGRRYPNCRLVLPETGNAVVTLEAVSMCEMTLRDNRTVARIGCKYIRPTMPALSLIQRHMMKLERDQRKRQ